MSFKKLVDEAMRHGSADAVLAEKSPPGWKGTVKAMKDEPGIDNEYALAWYMKKKGYKSHKRADGTDKVNSSIGESHAWGKKDRDPDWQRPKPDPQADPERVRAHDHKRAQALRDKLRGKQNEMIGVPGVAEDGGGYDAYKAEVDRVMQAKYGITWDDAAGDPEPIEDAMAGGESPEEFVDWWGEKYDLTPAGGGWYESIRVEHSLYGKGTVEEITESHIEITWDNLQNRITAPAKIDFADAKYLTRLREQYTADPEDAEMTQEKKGKPEMKKQQKQKVDESVVAVAMAPLQGTIVERDSDDLDLETLSLADLMEDGELPWEDDDGSEDEQGSDDNDQHSLRDAEDTRTYDGSDYVNVPRPSDSVLTNQEDQPSYKADPLSTMAGYDAADEGDEPASDDSQPVDAPEIPQVRDLEGSSSRHNTRDTGDGGDDTAEVDAGDYDESKPEDNGEDEMSKKNESLWLDADDLGLQLDEMEMGTGYAEGDGYDDEMREHEMTGDSIALSCDVIETLLKACSAQSPDEGKVKALCDGLKALQQEKGDATIEMGDMDSLKQKAAAAYGGAGDVGAEPEYEDKAVGDGEPAGPEGGEEHEGKTKMMDAEGKQHDLDGDGDEDSQDWMTARDRAIKGSMKRRRPKKSQQHEAKGGSSGTPVGTGNTSGSGGGGQHDLSKPKKYTGKPVGTGTSGAGGSSSDEYGQKPSADGGSNLVPEFPEGSQHGAADNPFSKGSPNPRNQKPLAAEGKKPANGKTKLDEAIMLGMSNIPTMRPGAEVDAPEEADWDDELATIKRRAGMDNWWQNNG